MLNTVVKLLEKTAGNYPDKLAVSDEVNEFTFADLRDRAREIASFIIRNTGRKNQAIPVEVDRSSLTVVLFMGVLYSGNFYVPVDNKIPKDQLSKLMTDIDPEISLSLKEGSIFHKQGYKEFSFEDLIKGPVDEELLADRLDSIIDMDPVYMIYTSGSTGNPKGVVISHRSLIDLSEFLTETFDITNEDVICNQAPFFFDCSVKCLYLMVRNGASLYILRSSYFMFPIKAVEFFNEKKITTLTWATSGLNIISSSGVFEKLRPESLSKVFFAGETLYGRDYMVWKEACPQGTRFINLYGPTEVTVDCTYYEIKKDFGEGDVIPIGKACPNMEVFLLDENDGPTPKGEIGEICARGTGISHGYYGDPEKSGGVFVQNPLNSNYRDIIYRTGDMGYVDEDGDIVFVSRKDNQIKHRGHRIELGEVEAASRLIEGLVESVAFYDYDDKKIVMAYVGDLEEKEVLKGLKGKLSAYMVPGVLESYEDFPRTRNGKVDRVGIKKLYGQAKGK
ncbi:MAG: amino acid adenylation domain-containing protein [Tissierellia bacterium]|nr:amino acid adenylation domain-containing protein [Tissierellia bacterium]